MKKVLDGLEVAKNLLLDYNHLITVGEVAIDDSDISIQIDEGYKNMLTTLEETKDETIIGTTLYKEISIDGFTVNVWTWESNKDKGIIKC